MRNEKHFPTILGLILLLASIVGGVFLTSSSRLLSSKASGDCRPDNLQITNITFNSAAISYLTSTDCQSIVQIDNHTIQDARAEGTGGDVPASKIHYFQIFSLNSSTSYNFSFVSGGTTFTSDKYVFKTAAKPAGDIPQSNLAWGRVLTPDQKPANNVIVYFNIPGAAPLSSYVTSAGNWNISLANSFNASETSWFQSPQDAVSEDIIVISADGAATQVSNTSDRNNPVPDIIIGQNFLSAPAVPTGMGAGAGLIPSVSPVASDISLTVSSPQQGESITTSRPDIFGTGPINTPILVTLQSNQSSSNQTQTNNAGVWHWSPTSDLATGQYTLMVTALNQTVTRQFSILTGNVGLAFSSSPSASIAPTKIPTSTPTVAPRSTPTLVPTNTPAPLTPTSVPTATPTFMPTSTPVSLDTSTPVPTAIRVSHPSTESGTPVTGDAAPTFIIIIVSVISILIARLLI